MQIKQGMFNNNTQIKQGMCNNNTQGSPLYPCWQGEGMHSGLSGPIVMNMWVELLLDLTLTLSVFLGLNQTYFHLH